MTESPMGGDGGSIHSACQDAVNEIQGTFHTSSTRLAARSGGGFAPG